MKIKLNALIFLGVLSVVSVSTVRSATPGQPDTHELERLAEQALAGGPHDADSAVSALRAGGPQILEPLRNQLYQTIGQKFPPSSSPDLSKVNRVLDKVCRQKDCAFSLLFWYEDLAAAQVAASAENKPILSLRMLGRLDEDLSCANSRFFRTMLYSNQRIADELRKNFVLHWSSEANIPKVHVDFGDGRSIDTTITGNSIHYVMNQTGEILDALPGLYSPQEFFDRLAAARRFHDKLKSQSSASARENLYKQFHLTKLEEIRKQWDLDLRLSDIDPDNAHVPAVDTGWERSWLEFDAPMLQTASRTNFPSKTAIERPLRLGLSLAPGAVREAATENLPELKPAEWIRLGALTDSVIWQKIADRRRPGVRFDAASLKLMDLKLSAGQEINLGQIEKNVALDTVRNEYMIHSMIHLWLANSLELRSFEALNDKVYAELFLTDVKDPWFGLIAPGSFLALDGNGLKRE